MGDFSNAGASLSGPYIGVNGPSGLSANHRPGTRTHVSRPADEQKGGFARWHLGCRVSGRVSVWKRAVWLRRGAPRSQRRVRQLGKSHSAVPGHGTGGPSKRLPCGDRLPHIPLIPVPLGLLTFAPRSSDGPGDLRKRFSATWQRQVSGRVELPQLVLY